MASIAVSFTPAAGAPVPPYDFQFRNFGGNEMPRTYIDSTTFSPSANGANALSGPAYPQKRIWAITSMISTADAEYFDEMYRAWDADRAAGLPTACGVVDDTFGATVTTNAVFSTAPTYARSGPQYTTVSFGLTEV